MLSAPFAGAAVALAASVAAAPVAAPAPAPVPMPIPNIKSIDGLPQFNLQTEVQGQDNPDVNNLYVSTFHTGAGLNAAVGTANKTIATPFTLKDSFVEFTVEGTGGSEDIEYAFGLPHVNAYLSNAPSTYNVVEIDIVNQTSGFVVNNDYLEHPNSDFTTFAMCYVNATAPYVSLGPQYQLFWKDNMSSTGASNCADVKLKTLAVT